MWYLSKTIIAEQIKLDLHLNLRLLKKKIDFDFDNNIFNVDNVKVSDLNYWTEKSSFTDWKY